MRILCLVQGQYDPNQVTKYKVKMANKENYSGIII